MKITTKMTRKLIEYVLTKGINVSLDIAGSFLPGWPVIKPLIEKLVEDLPGDISKKYRSSEKDVEKILLTLENNEVLVDPISKALAQQGITDQWIEKSIGLLEKLSDDVLELLAKQQKQEDTLHGVMELLERLVAKGPAKIELRAQKLDYTNHFEMPESFLVGWDFAPGSVIKNQQNRLIPIGSMIWDFLLLNTGQQLATISRMEIQVEEQFTLPENVVYSGVKPAFDAYEDIVELQAGAKSYPVFQNKRLKYAPEIDVDAFRILCLFISEDIIIQKIKLAVYWLDGTGEHVSYGPSLFICSEKPGRI